MTNTVPATPDEEPTAELGRTIEPYEAVMQPAEVEPAPAVDEVVDQLRQAGFDASDWAVCALAVHAGRRQLSYDQVVAVLAQFAPRRWDALTRAAAARLLADIGARQIPVVLEIAAAEASGDAAYHLELVQALAEELKLPTSYLDPRRAPTYVPAEPAGPVTPVQVLTEVTRLCNEGLPVPSAVDIHETGTGEIWLAIRFNRRYAGGNQVAVDAWASHLGLTAAFDEPAYDEPDGRRWKAYEIDRWGAQAEACWAPGVTRVHVWCAVDVEAETNDEEGRS